MAQDPNIDALHDLPEGTGAQRASESMGTARMLVDVVLGGVRAAFLFDSSYEFRAVNDNRRRAQAAAAKVIPEIRPDTAAIRDFVPAPVAEVPPPVPVTRLSRFADEKLPTFDLRPAQPDPLELDPLGLDALAANDNIAAANDNTSQSSTAPQTITRIRA